jgi:uncharacterized damage-inducible protein DinB
MKDLVEHNLCVLAQVEGLLQQLNDDEHAAPRPLLFGSSIGQHIRHVLEYYGCFVSSFSSGTVSYDRRLRDLAIETSVSAAAASARQSAAQLRNITSDGPLVLCSDLPGLPLASAQDTTMKRELVYLADHSVHHMAMVRIALEQCLPHVAFPTTLGIAVSTRNHQMQ